MSSPIETVARRLRLGHWLYQFWHRPRAALARSRREGGPIEQWRNARGRREMVSAAAQLPPLPPVKAGAPEITFLTGKRFWYQTALCCWSLRRHAGDLRPVFIDDGTFDRELFAECQRVFPGAEVQERVAIGQRIDAHLPASRFPSLRSQRETYIHLRKITDVHAGLAGWRIVLDSDMLFFRRPDALLQWLASPDSPIHMLDVQDAYGYPAATLAGLAGRPVPAHVNVGVCGLRSDAIDWPQLEAWCAELLRRHGTSYYLEQALVALWLSRTPAQRLLADEYRLLPDESECRSPRAVLHHYVDQSKRSYFRHAWREALARTTAVPSLP